MGEVKAFTGVQHIRADDTAPNRDVIAFLRELLRRAKAGKVRAVAVVTVVNPEVVNNAWSPGNSPHSHLLMAGIADLQYRYARGRYGDDEEG